MHRGLHIYKSARKVQPTWTKPNCLPKTKKDSETLIQKDKNTQSDYWEGIWHIKMCHTNKEKRKKTFDGRIRSKKSLNKWR